MRKKFLGIAVSLVISIIWGLNFFVSSTAYSYCCYYLRVPFLTQVAPGDWSNTKNCGQTCAVMLCGYFNGTPVNSAKITEQNAWLAMYTGDSRYNSPNGWYTGGNSLTAYRQILLNVHGLKTSVYYGKDIYDILYYGCQKMPVIVGVLIKDGRLVSDVKDKYAVSHWAIVVGCDGNKIILNDPGTSSGNGIKYDVATFTSSWSTQGKIYMPVSR